MENKVILVLDTNDFKKYLNVTYEKEAGISLDTYE